MRRLSFVIVVGVVAAINAPSAGAAGLSEGFDGASPPLLPSGWLTGKSGSEPTFWATSAASPDGARLNNAFVPDVAGVNDKFLFSPTQTLNAAPTLSFRNNFILEDGFDGGVLEVARNGAAFQDIVAAGGTFAQGGYTDTISVSFSSPIAGRQAWSGNSGGYIDTRVNMPFVNDGDTIQLRWRMASDQSLSATGWRVDSVLLGHPPVGATTDAASGLSTAGATLNGTFTSDLPATYQFQYGPTVAYGSQTPPVEVSPSNAPQSRSDTVSGLEPNTTYHYRLTAGNAFSSVSGADQTFLTSSTPPPNTPPPDTDPPPDPPDTTAPETAIDGLTQNKKKTKATFAFSANEAGSTFECAVDAAAFAACASPTTVKKVRKGKHTFSVRARDAAGNTDQSPAQRQFKIKKKRKRR